MNIEVELSFDTFIVKIEGKATENIPAYLLKYGSLSIFGRDAFSALEIYPQYVVSLSRAWLEDDLKEFIKIIEFMQGYVYSRYSSYIQVLAIPDDLDDNYYNTVSRCFGIERCRRINSQKPQYIKRTAAIARIYSIATNSLLSNEIRSAQYCSFHGQMFSFLKSGYMEILRDSLKKKMRLAQSDGTVTEYAIRQYASPQDEQTELGIIREESLKVMFISPFSYGKTTLINAVAGFDVLKMEYTAETSAITELIGAPVRIVSIEYQNGKTKRIPYRDLDDLKQILPRYNSVSSGRNDIKNIKVYSPDTDVPYVTLMDTPGLMSVNEKHDEITEHEIDMADVTVFVIDPELIGDRAYMLKVKEFIDNKITGSVAFLINRYDLWNDRQEILQQELSKVLDHFGIHSAIKLKMSGLFCYVAKNVLKGRLNLTDVQKMKNIIFEDNKGNLIAGRTLTKEHMKQLLKLSNSEELNKYLFSEYESKMIAKKHG